MRLFFWRHQHKWVWLHPPFQDDQERCFYGPATCECGEMEDGHWEYYG